MTNYSARAEQVMRRIEELAAISEDERGVTRTFGTPAFLQGRALVQGWMEAAGLEVRTDSIGNLRGRLVSANPAAKTFVIASHIDTVVNAGKYDGPLGVLMGLDLLENLSSPPAPLSEGVGENKIRHSALPFHLELIAFSDEEGVRYHTTYLGSKVVAGSFDAGWLTRADANGISLADALSTMDADATSLAADAIPAADFLGYFEPHIEQGPVLWEKQVPVAVVKGIAGQRRAELVWRGMAGHAGTVPMELRQDALCAAAEFILAAEEMALTHKETLVATVGKLTVTNAASNVIPGDVTCSLDLRSADADRLASAYEKLQNEAESIGRVRNVAVEWHPVQQSAPVACDAALNNLLAQAIQDAGHEVIALVSGAGHDAVPVAAVAPVSMLFIRCYKGISHNPLENVEVADLAAALEVSERFLEFLVSSC